MERKFEPPPPGVDPRFSSFNQNTQPFKPPEAASNSFGTQQNRSRGVPGAGWADDDDTETLRKPGQPPLPHQTAPVHAPSPAAPVPVNPPVMRSYEQPKHPELAVSTEAGVYESRLVDGITQPGGARMKPQERELNEFAANCKYLNCDIVSALLFQQFGTRGRSIKALYVLEKLARQYEGYQTYIKSNRQQFMGAGQESEMHRKVVQNILNVVDGVQEPEATTDSVNLLEEPKMTTKNVFDLNMGRNEPPPPAPVQPAPQADVLFHDQAPPTVTNPYGQMGNPPPQQAPVQPPVQPDPFGLLGSQVEQTPFEQPSPPVSNMLPMETPMAPAPVTAPQPTFEPALLSPSPPINNPSAQPQHPVQPQSMPPVQPSPQIDLMPQTMNPISTTIEQQKEQTPPKVQANPGQMMPPSNPPPQQMPMTGMPQQAPPQGMPPQGVQMQGMLPQGVPSHGMPRGMQPPGQPGVQYIMAPGPQPGMMQQAPMVMYPQGYPPQQPGGYPQPMYIAAPGQYPMQQPVYMMMQPGAQPGQMPQQPPQPEDKHKDAFSDLNFL